MDMFAAAVQIVLEVEGVFSNQAGDPGGPTYYGIARASHPDIPWPPTKDQAVAIYKAEYWDANHCDDMPWKWALGVFDGAVNESARHTAAFAEAALGTLLDSEIGPHDIAAMKIAGDELFQIFLALRGIEYTKAPLFPKDGKGWFKRLFKIAQAGEHPPAV